MIDPKAYEQRLSRETSVLSEHGLSHYWHLTAEAVAAATKHREDPMAKASSGTRLTRVTPAQARKMGKRSQREGAVFRQTPGARCELWVDQRLVEHDVPYAPDSMADALRRRRVPKGTKVSVETMDGHRTPLTLRW